MAASTTLSVIIPAYNEEQRLPDTLRQVYAYLRQQAYAYEVIVVDDGSSDATCRMVEAFFATVSGGVLLRNDGNRGKGFSVRRGVLASVGEFALFTDADLSTPIQEVEKLLAALHAGCDIAIGSRGLRTSDVRRHQPFYREYMGKIFNLFAKVFALTPFADTQCGFKCFRGDVARAVFARQQINHFSFDVEVLFIAARHRYTIREVPIQWVNNPNSRVNALTDSTKMFEDLCRIRWNAWKGKYD